MAPRHRSIAILVLLFLSGCATTDTIHSVRFSPEPGVLAAGQPESLVLPTNTCGDYFIAETYIDGAGPFAMLLDTGASITVISPTAASEAGVHARIERIDIGGLHIAGRIRCTVWDVDHLSHALGVEIDGILGHQVFRTVLLTYDYPEHQIRVRLGELSDELPGVAPMSPSKRPFIGAMLGDRKINVLLDTGSAAGLSLVRFDKLPFVEDPRTVGMRMRIDGPQEVRAGRVTEDIAFGSFTLSQPIVRDAAGASLLGQRVLREFVLTLDQKRGRVQIVHADGTAVIEPIASPSLFGAGWMPRRMRNRLVVAHVFPGTAAESAGFRQDDVVLAVNGTLLADIGCTRHEVLAGRPMQATYLIERGDERLEIELTTDVLVR